MNKRIYIVNIREYRGGTLVLSALCGLLRELGYDARLLIVPYLPEEKIARINFYKDCIVKNTKYLIKSVLKKYIARIYPSAKFVKHFVSQANVLNIKGIKIQWYPFINKNSIVIYPEVVYGNVLGAKNVARWLLYKYYHKDDKGAYNKDDFFFAYRDIFDIPEFNPNHNIITIHYFNKELYRQYNPLKERVGNCYLIYKGRNRSDLPTKFDGPIIDSKMPQEEIVDILNNCKYCYCYDPQTFYMQIAAVCGCIPILVMEPNKTEKDYLSDNENHYGIAYGDNEEQIKYAVDTREKCLSLLNYDKQNRENALQLIRLLQNRFGSIKRI